MSKYSIETVEVVPAPMEDHRTESGATLVNTIVFTVIIGAFIASKLAQESLCSCRMERSIGTASLLVLSNL